MRILLANFTKMVADSGGLAKVTCLFANEMLRRGHKVALLYSDEKKGDFFFPLAKGVKCFNLKERKDGSLIKMPVYYKVARELLRPACKRWAASVDACFQERYLVDNLLRYLALTDPDIIVSFQPAASKLLLDDAACLIPVISMSHGDPEDYFINYPVREYLTLTKSAVCQVLLPSFEEHIKRHLTDARTITIGNAVPHFKEAADLALPKKRFKVISVGTLSKNHKRPHLLIRAFIKLAAKYPEWDVDIWGARAHAAYYKELQVLIASAGLSERVKLRGVTDDVYQELVKADIFVFPSAYEGFGLALAEAMSCGLPAVGYRSCPAVNELIADGETGLLCADGSEALAEAIDTLMGNQELRIKMGGAARKAMARYAPEKIWDRWEELLKEISAKK